MNGQNDSTSFEFNRRSILRSASAALGSVAATGTTAASLANPVEDEDFEEREWGYVRKDFEPPSGDPKATVLQMDGYGRAEPPTHYIRVRDGELISVKVGAGPPLGHRDEYAPVQASLRGTGCSGGQFDVFDRFWAKDGYDIIEWLADRKWARDGVGLYGNSLPGITGFLITSHQPPSLAAAMPNLLYADLYRCAVVPGGVPNVVFTSIWSQVIQPTLDTEGTAEGLLEEDTICAQNVATRSPQFPADSELFYALRREDDSEWRQRSLIEYADQINVPICMTHAWQDEQTGPRGGPEIFRTIDPDPVQSPDDVPGTGPPPGVPGLQPKETPKMFWATNGNHSTDRELGRTAELAEDWFDYWLLGKRTGIMDKNPVQLYLNSGVEESSIKMSFDSFHQNEQIDWTRYYLGEENSLQATRPDGGADEYITGSPRRSWVFGDGGTGGEVTWADGPDLLTYRTDSFDDPKVIAGPITATLYIESTAPEMDLFVTLADEYPSGTLVPLQRGLLRASHRRLNEERTLYNDDGDIIRPYRPHTNPEPIEPGEVYRYDVEVFPLGHLIHSDHRLVMGITTPPLVDGLWGYEPSRSPGVNQVYRDEDRPSSLLLPLVELERDEPPEPECGAPAGYRCINQT